MASSIYENFKIKVGIVKFNGAVCTDPIVEIVSTGENILQGCCYDSGYIVGQINRKNSSDSKANCITFWVRCKESDCHGNKLITKCLCETKEDCADCNECVNGICEPLCPEEQCYNGECKECADDEACPCNKKCRNGECTCDPGTKDCGDGCCSQCCNSEDCGPCSVCVNGECEDRNCGEGQCDPIDDTCKECVNDIACKNPNECCIDNKCDCCKGFTRDNCTGECVALPVNPCTNNTDCPSCSDCTNINECTGYGSCSARDCPGDRVCIDDQCKEPCECSGGGCSSRTTYCDSDPLAYGCFCEECPKNSCIEGDGSCEAGSKGNCTCVDGECVPKTCDCGPKQICVANQCVDKNCLADLTLEKTRINNDCNLTATSTLDCCPCDPLEIVLTPTLNPTGITYSALFLKDGIALSNNLPTNDIAGNEEPSQGLMSYEVILEEKTEIWNNGIPSGIITTRDVLAGKGTSDSFNGQKDTLTSIIPISFKPGDEVRNEEISSTSRRITTISRIKINFYLERTLSPNNCEYSRQYVTQAVFNSLAEYNTPSVITGEADPRDGACRYPLFKWRKNGVLIRKIYIPRVNDQYQDTLFGPNPISVSNENRVVLPPDEGDLQSCNNYEIEVDCACSEPQNMDVKFCDAIDTAEAVSKNKCNTEVDIFIPDTCDVNDNLTFRILTNFGIEGDLNGINLPYSDTITRIEPIEFVTFQMLCNDESTVACEKTITFDVNKFQATPVYECPNIIRIPSVDSTGTVRVTSATINGTLVAGNSYALNGLEVASGQVEYVLTFEDRCSKDEGVLTFVCDCASNPCSANQLTCGTLIDQCGKEVTCSQTKADKQESIGCEVENGENTGYEVFQITSYSCINNIWTPQTPTTTRIPNAILCPIPEPEQLYSCGSSGCVPDSNGVSLTTCQDSCISVDCINGVCTEVDGDGGTYETLTECNNSSSCTPAIPTGSCCDGAGNCDDDVEEADCTGDWSETRTCSQRIAGGETGCGVAATLGSCCDGSSCQNNITEASCDDINGEWSANPCSLRETEEGCFTQTIYYAQCNSNINGTECVSTGPCSGSNCYTGNSPRAAILDCQDSGNCISPTGACCTGPGTCSITTQEACSTNDWFEGLTCQEAGCDIGPSPDCGCGQPVPGGGCDCNASGSQAICDAETGGFSTCSFDDNLQTCVCNPVQ
jgi:hypothetical protein